MDNSTLREGRTFYSNYALVELIKVVTEITVKTDSTDN